jgi:hypothetical protein
MPKKVSKDRTIIVTSVRVRMYLMKFTLCNPLNFIVYRMNLSLCFVKMKMEKC